MSIKLLSFDLDDTLWPCWITIIKAEKILHDWFSVHYPEISKKYSIKQLQQQRTILKQQHTYLAHDISAIRRLSLQQLAIEIHLNQKQSQQFVKQAFTIYYRARNQVQLFDDVLPVLKQLKPHYQMIGVSNGNADVNQTQTELKQLLQFTWSAAQAGKEKPDPKIFYDIMEKTQLQGDNIIHIGDDPYSDICGAANAGIRSIWINRDKKNWPAEIKSASYVIENLFQLHDILKHF